MTTFSLIATFGALTFLLGTAISGSILRSRPLHWGAPAVIGLGFLAFSLWVIVMEPVPGFWTLHTQSYWGNQVWLDLLIAATLGWWLLLPRARRVGMPVSWWWLAIICTGSIGLCGMFARILYLEHTDSND